MVRNVVTNLGGFSINDVLDTDYDTLVAVLASENQDKQDVMPLEDFVNQL